MNESRSDEIRLCPIGLDRTTSENRRMKKDKVKLAEVLKREFKERDLSLAMVSKLCGIPKSTLHDWACGRLPNSKNLHYLKSLSDFLNVSIGGLLFNTDESDTTREVLFSTKFTDEGKQYAIRILKEKNKNQTGEV